jgi:TolB protein
MSDEIQADPQPSPAPRRPRQIALRPITIILFLTVNLIVLMILGWPYLKARYDLPWDLPLALLPSISPGAVTPSGLEAVPPESTSTPILTPTASATLPVLETDPDLWARGLIVLSLQEGLDTHLFAFQPLAGAAGVALPLTRLTSGSWQDITPALSPEKNRLAFASNRGGFWNLYLLDLRSGEVSQVTNSPDYEASPSWSPDGLWMAYEAYVEESLDIVLKPVDGSQDPIQLTSHPGADYEPAWAPNGRQIAFVSTRGGRNQVWLANLDESGAGRFLQLNGHEEASAAHPVWSPDGRSLAWGAVTTEGLHKIYVWDSHNPGGPPREIGSGDWAAWSPDGEALLVILNTPHQAYLTAYPVDQDGYIILQPFKLPGAAAGLLWADMGLSGDLVAVDLPTPTPLWDMDINVSSEGIDGRWDLVALDDIEAPYPRLHDRVDESFQAFREKLAALVGWDLLASLDNAYLPISSALSPGLVEDWLYTGRAFTVNTLPINAGWMAVVREDFGQQTFWRVYLRARFQDGNQGKPLFELPWDFNARYSGQPSPYDQGGERAVVLPGGYWVDMTRLAAVFGWERLSALSNWRVVYPAARFNEFVKTDGLDWDEAMLEIYPREVLLTLTPIPTATTSMTPAPLWYKSPTPTPSDTLTPTLTATATRTASPTPTTTPPKTLTATTSPSVTPTPTVTNTSEP